MKSKKKEGVTLSPHPPNPPMRVKTLSKKVIDCFVVVVLSSCLTFNSTIAHSIPRASKLRPTPFIICEQALSLGYFSAEVYHFSWDNPRRPKGTLQGS